MKREPGTFVNKAPACAKKALKQMTEYLYSTAVTAAGYQNAALLCLLWYLFGRASDLTLLRKANLSIGSGDIFFVRFIRVKTSEEQGLSLFPDDDFATCPLLAIVLVLIIQHSPTVSPLSQFPEQQSKSCAVFTPATPLLDLIDHPEPVAQQDASGNKAKSADALPGIHSYVNRVLDRVVAKSGVTEKLTSHSFRRGEAQHANTCDQLTARWIFDRGTWNMTTTNKGFSYIFNTSSEDHKISKILSGHDADASATLQTLKAFDSQTRTKIDAAQRLLFSTCQDLDATRHNVNQPVLDVLTACVLRQYPLLKELNPDAPVLKRVEACVVHSGSSLAELLGWSSHLVSAAWTCENINYKSADRTTSQAFNPTEESEEQKTIRHQAAVINHLNEHAQRQHVRMDALEAKLNNAPLESTNKRQKQDHADDENDGFELDTAAPDYRDGVLDLGKQAEKAVLAFLVEWKVTSRGSGTILKHLRTLHRSGDLNTMIKHHQRLLQTASIKYPAPGYTQDVLEVVRQ